MSLAIEGKKTNHSDMQIAMMAVSSAYCYHGDLCLVNFPKEGGGYGEGYVQSAPPFQEPHYLYLNSIRSICVCHRKHKNKICMTPTRKIDI